jgi:hypothetical protein
VLPPSEPWHVVTANQLQVTSEAPPFASIATKPGFDAARIADIPSRSPPQDAELARIIRRRIFAAYIAH